LPFLSAEAETSQVDSTLPAELNVKPHTTATGASQVDLALELGSAKTITAVVTDLAKLVPEFGPGALPRGVISLSVWKNQLVTIDYPRWRVTIEQGALAEADGKDVFSLGPARELNVPLSLADRSVTCRVDPFFAGGIVVPATFVKDLPVAGRSIPRGAVRTPRGMLDVQKLRLDGSVRLANFEISNPVLQSSDRVSTALVGAQTLAGFSVTYDLSNARGRLQREKNPPVGISRRSIRSAP
jgi:hypothetical protein